jgi:hypothetical protein
VDCGDWFICLLLIGHNSDMTLLYVCNGVSSIKTLSRATKLPFTQTNTLRYSKSHLWCRYYYCGYIRFIIIAARFHVLYLLHDGLSYISIKIMVVWYINVDKLAGGGFSPVLRLPLSILIAPALHAH